MAGSNYSWKTFQMQTTCTDTIPPVSQAYAMHFSNIKMHYSTLSLKLIGMTLFCFLSPPKKRKKRFSVYATGQFPQTCCFSEQFLVPGSSCFLSFCPAGNNNTKTNQILLSPRVDKWCYITEITLLLIHSWIVMKNKWNHWI